MPRDRPHEQGRDAIPDLLPGPAQSFSEPESLRISAQPKKLRPRYSLVPVGMENRSRDVRAVRPYRECRPIPGQATQVEEVPGPVDPSRIPAASVGGPRRAKRTIKQVVIETLAANSAATNGEMIAAVKAEFPKSAFSETHAAWYRSQARRGLLTGTPISIPPTARKQAAAESNTA